MAGEVKCRTCGKGPTEARLMICAMCHSRFCGEHSYRRGGKPFCSKRCAEEFFLAEDPDAPPTSPWAEDDES
ncbi:MAG: hypothetical protein MUF27_14170 [Acidobacteria bacterium]|jgi:hypothetical protein|nr:hypothetical protein [Acidobacteriota bacterium]